MSSDGRVAPKLTVEGKRALKPLTNTLSFYHFVFLGLAHTAQVCRNEGDIETPFPLFIRSLVWGGGVCVIVQLDDEDKVVSNAVVACRLDPIHLLRLGGDATQLY